MQRLIGDMVSGPSLGEYLLSIGVIGARIVSAVPKTIDYIVETIEHRDIDSLLHDKLVLDKYTNTRKIGKDEEFTSDRMCDSMLICTAYNDHVEESQLHTIVSGISNRYFGRDCILEVNTAESYIDTIERMSRLTQRENYQACGIPYRAIMFPKEKIVVHSADHYYVDGMFVFDVIQNMLGASIGCELPKLKIPPHIYIPIVSDALIAKHAIEQAKSFVSYPPQNVIGHPTTITLLALPHEGNGRWNVYAESLFPLFQASNRDYFRVAITVAVTSPRFYINNRVSVISFILKRPIMTQDRSVIIAKMAESIKTQVERNYLEMFTTFDIQATFDITVPRKFGLKFRNICDVTFSPFFLDIPKENVGSDMVDEFLDNDICRGCGCFGGSFDFPFIYISSVATYRTNSTTYQTNVADIDVGKIRELYKSELVHEFSDLP